MKNQKHKVKFSQKELGMIEKDLQYITMDLMLREYLEKIIKKNHEILIIENKSLNDLKSIHCFFDENIRDLNEIQQKLERYITLCNVIGISNLSKKHENNG